MTAVYPLVKHAHMAMLSVSVLLFAVRGAGVLAWLTVGRMVSAAVAKPPAGWLKAWWA